MKQMNALNDIEWIFFDIGSTLVDEEIAYINRIKSAVSSTDYTYEQVYEKAVEGWSRNMEGDKYALNYFGLPIPLWDITGEKLYNDAEYILEKLSHKYKIGIIANQLPGTAVRLKNFGISEYIDIVVASAEEGVSKPDAAIFNIALERAGCNAQNAVMVGDRLDNDIAPAKKLGMKTIWIKQGGWKYASPRNENETPDITISELIEISDVFES